MLAKQDRLRPVSQASPSSMSNTTLPVPSMKHSPIFRVEHVKLRHSRKWLAGILSAWPWKVSLRGEAHRRIRRIMSESDKSEH